MRRYDTGGVQVSIRILEIFSFVRYSVQICTRERVRLQCQCVVEDHVSNFRSSVWLIGAKALVDDGTLGIAWRGQTVAAWVP